MAAKKTQQRSRKKNKSSSASGFYKVMAVLAVIGVIAALYFSGHISNVVGQITGGMIHPEPSAVPVVTSTAGDTTTTRLTTTTSTATTTTSTTTTTAKTITTTTTATQANTFENEAENNGVSGSDAEYVLSPDYESPYYIVVFTGSQSVVVYGKDENGRYNVKTKCFTCSSGAKGTPTRTGLYSILRSYRWRALMGGVYGQYCSGFSSSYLFHSVLYDTTDESTLFENSYSNLGKAASHGCIRLCVRDAKWIYDNCPIGTQVRVVNASGPAGESDLPALKSGDRYRGWEPTDPNENNPYNN